MEKKGTFILDSTTALTVGHGGRNNLWYGVYECYDFDTKEVSTVK
jgi:hypothetical protein